MKKPGTIIAGGLLVLLAGCATGPAGSSPGAPAGGVEPPAARAGRAAPAAVPAGGAADTPPAGFYFLEVESDPPGCTVVVDGMPVGKAPLRLTLPGTDRGFFREEVSIRVRFIAEGAGRPSASIEEKLSPTDRIPARIVFTPAGARRVR